MEPTSEEYASEMRVAFDRQHSADGAAPPGLKKPRTSEVTLSPALSLHSSLSHPPVSPSRRSRAPGGRSRGPHAAGHERCPRPVTAQRPHGAGPRGQGTGPTAPTARRSARRPPARAGDRPSGPDRTPPAPPAGSFPGRRARAPAPPGSQSPGCQSPPSTGRSTPSTGPSIVQGKSTVVSCRSMLDCSSLFMCERCLM